MVIALFRPIFVYHLMCESRSVCSRQFVSPAGEKWSTNALIPFPTELCSGANRWSHYFGALLLRIRMNVCHSRRKHFQRLSAFMLDEHNDLHTVHVWLVAELMRVFSVCVCRWQNTFFIIAKVVGHTMLHGMNVSAITTMKCWWFVSFAIENTFRVSRWKLHCILFAFFPSSANGLGMRRATAWEAAKEWQRAYHKWQMGKSYYRGGVPGKRWCVHCSMFPRKTSGPTACHQQTAESPKRKWKIQMGQRNVQKMESGWPRAAALWI